MVPLTVSVNVSGPAVPRGGDDDILRNTRLHWLNADTGRSGAIPAPFGPVRTHGSLVNGSFFSLEVMTWTTAVFFLVRLSPLRGAHAALRPFV